MDKSTEQKVKYLYLAIFFFLIYISFLIVKPFILAVITSFIVAYLIYPVYIRLDAFIKNRNLRAFVLIFLLFVVILVPSFFIAEKLIAQSVQLYHNTVDLDLGQLNKLVKTYFDLDIQLEQYVREITSKFLNALLKDVSDFAFSLPKKLVVMFVSIFVTYYLLKEGDVIIHQIKKYLPLKEDDKNELIERLKNVTYATVYGVIATAIIQGIVGMIGMFIFKIESPILLGVIMIITAMLPFGAAIVWLPAALIKIFSGDLFNGIGFLIYSLIIVSLIDNFIRPSLISKRSRTHPIIILLGVLGGLSLFGFIGILIGPLILAVFMAFLDFYIKEYDS